MFRNQEYQRGLEILSKLESIKQFETSLEWTIPSVAGTIVFLNQIMQVLCC